MLFWGLVIIIVIMITLNFFLRLMAIAKRADDRARKILGQSEVENNTYSN